MSPTLAETPASLAEAAASCGSGGSSALGLFCLEVGCGSAFGVGIKLGGYFGASSGAGSSVGAVDVDRLGAKPGVGGSDVIGDEFDVGGRWTVGGKWDAGGRDVAGGDGGSGLGGIAVSTG